MRIRVLGIILLVFLMTGLSIQAQGGVLNYGDNTVGSLTATSPLNLFSFSGTSGDRITIVVIGITPGFDPAISLLSPTQQQLATNDNDPTSPGSTDARITVSLMDTGIHTILVNSVTASSGDYLIRLFGQPAIEATDVSESEVVTSTSGETQVFSINASPDGPLMVTVSTTTPDLLLVVRLFDPTGQSIAVSSGSDNTLNIPAGDGVYIIEVSPVDPDIVGYVYVGINSIDQTPPPPPPTPPPPASTEEVEAPSGLCMVSAPAGVFVNVRSGPTTDFAVVYSLEPNGSLEVTGAYQGWYRVNTPDVGTGWVFGGVVTTDGSCDAVPVVSGDDVPSDPAQPQQATPTYTATTDSQPLQATPTYTNTIQPLQATATTETGQATATYTATLEGQQPTATQPQQATATSTASYTPTIVPEQATATYTPSYTPTTPPPPQIAPEDARFNNPLNIPLDSTASVLDFVSYPGGDTEDRVRWDITGMNPNSSLSGGQARLVISVTCFGENTDQVQFFTGGQTYTCGQTIVDQEVTNDSRTGSVTITAVGGDGTYVQWVLTGTATRTN